MTDDTEPVAGSGWTMAEINAAVDAWVEMYQMQQSGQSFVKAEIVRNLQSDALSVRSKTSVERRFMNISAVAIALEHDYIQGYRPLSNVGRNQWDRIQARLESQGLDSDDLEPAIIAEIDILNEQGIAGFEASRVRERAWQQVTQRRGQSRFRDLLLEVYDSRCAVTRANEPVVLQAAHIEPYSGAASNVATNGLLLKSDIHLLFDRGLLAIEPDSLTTVIAPSLRDGQFGLHEGQRILVPENPSYRPDPRLLHNHLEQAESTW